MSYNNICYIINGSCKKVRSLKDIKTLLSKYNIQEVIKGPKWLKPSIYFYMVEK
jgi:hypothetical protein